MNTVQHADTSLIRQLECFRYLDDDVATLRRYFFRYEYPAGSYVFRERAHGGYMFFIADGEAEVIKQYDNARTTITTLGRGHSIGEMSLIDGRSRSAMVRARRSAASVTQHAYRLIQPMNNSGHQRSVSVQKGPTVTQQPAL